jgi:hypothetical protein
MRIVFEMSLPLMAASLGFLVKFFTAGVSGGMAEWQTGGQ